MVGTNQPNQRNKKKCLPEQLAGKTTTTATTIITTLSFETLWATRRYRCKIRIRTTNPRRPYSRKYACAGNSPLTRTSRGYFSRACALRPVGFRPLPCYYSGSELVAGHSVTSGSDGALLLALGHSGKNRVLDTGGPVERPTPL